MPFSPSMDPQKNPKKSEIIIVDQSALAKSAAWAWYERGSGSRARPICEVDVWSSKSEPRPSRYKLELLRNLEFNSNYKNSLLDNYEIERISQQLDQYIESTHAKFHGSDPVAATVAGDKGLQKKKTARGFRWRHVPACGSSRNDVVENRRVGRRPEKGCVVVVGHVKCRPRPPAIRA